MKIVFTVGYYPPDKRGGGATEVVRQLAERLSAGGHDIEVACSSYGSGTLEQVNRVAVRRFRIQSPLGQSVLGIRGEVSEFIEYLRRPSIDVVVNYAAQTWHADTTFRVLDQIKAAKVLCACGFSGLIWPRRLLYWRYFRRLPGFLRRYDAVVYHSKQYIDIKFAERSGLRNGCVIPNGVDGRAFGQKHMDIRRKYGIREKYILLCVGDHYKNKGHDRVMDALELCREDVCLLVYGRAVGNSWRSCENSCSRRSQRAGRRVILVGGATREEIVSAYASASLLLSGSRVEAFPLVALEAMASSLPFVAFPAGNFDELPGGVLVRSVGEMACAIDSLLVDRRRREALALKGKQAQMDNYEWDRVAGLYMELFKGLREAKEVSA